MPGAEDAADTFMIRHGQLLIPPSVEYEEVFSSTVRCVVILNRLAWLFLDVTDQSVK